MSDPLSVLFVNMHHGWGGQPATVLNMAKGLSARGHACVVGAPDGSDLCARAEAAGLPILSGLEFRRGFHPLSILRDARIMRSAVVERGISVVESNGSQDTWVSVLALRGIRDKTRLVRWRHNSFPVAAHVLNRMLYGRWIDMVIVSAAPIAEPLVQGGLLTREKTAVIHPAADMSRFAEEFDRQAIRRELGLAEDDLVVVAVGRLAPEKGHRVLLAAAKAVVAKEPRAMFLIVGTGALARELEGLAAELGLGDRVVFAGFREDVPRVLSACDINALTPVSGESFGIALIEGFCAGLAAVATDVGGVSSVCRDGQTGLLCPPGDHECIARSLSRLLSDAELRDRLARNGKRMALEEFTEEAMIARAEALFREVAGAAPGGGVR